MGIWGESALSLNYNSEGTSGDLVDGISHLLVLAIMKSRLVGLGKSESGGS